MRHDPDILLLGELREMETIKLALGCASMGMLVFGTLVAGVPLDSHSLVRLRRVRDSLAASSGGRILMTTLRPRS